MGSLPKFVLIGAAGYIAPKHMQAIKDCGGDLVAALDPHESVGILDKFFPDCEYFNSVWQLHNFIDENPVDYVSICSPTDNHRVSAINGMRWGADVICEKPLVLTVEELETLRRVEIQTGKRVYTILQLRYHPLMAEMKAAAQGKNHEVEIDYATPRGRWYHNTWKIRPNQSGGLATNIGIHLFDTAINLFGPSEREPEITLNLDDVMSGTLYLHRATVRWSLSIDRGWKARRVFMIDGKNFDLSNGFTDLHSEVYRQVLAGKGTGIDHVAPSVRMTETLRGLSNGQSTAHCA
jgi:UDP-N-acetyl-2-amino-2-deoxyglucuronate dehydrogenase